MWFVNENGVAVQQLFPMPMIKLTKLEKERKKTSQSSDATKTDTGGNTNETDKGDSASTTTPNTNGDDTSSAATNGATDTTQTTTKGKEDENENETDKDDDMTLEEMGIKSGLRLAIEFGNVKKGEYIVKAREEENALRASTFKVDDNWKKLEKGDKIDARDNYKAGTYYAATILKVKEAGEKVTEDEKLFLLIKKGVEDETILDEFEKIKGVYVHYEGWEDKWNEWIYLTKDRLCNCQSKCKYTKATHRLAAPNTQSEIAKQEDEQRRNNGMSGVGGSMYSRSRRDTIRGAPKTSGVVGLANLGNTCFMNSILQCISNTPHFRSFFTSGQYRQDINKKNPLGTQGKLANEFAKLLIDIWSGNYRVVAPRSVKSLVGRLQPRFLGYGQQDSQEFLSYLLDGLHEDLNLIKDKPYTEKIEADGRPDNIVAQLSWKIYLMRNKSKIVDLFQKQLRSRVECPDCHKISVTFDTYMYLSVPIGQHMNKTIILDVFHLNDRNINITDVSKYEANKPVRHVFHMNKYEHIDALARAVGKLYDCNPNFVIFAQVKEQAIWKQFEQSDWIDQLPQTTKLDSINAISCFVLKDWNSELTNDVKSRVKNMNQLRLQMVRCTQIGPLEDYYKKESEEVEIAKEKYAKQGKDVTKYAHRHSPPNYGMPFIIAGLNVTTLREFYQLIYCRLYLWMTNILYKYGKPPILKVESRIVKDEETGKDIVEYLDAKDEDIEIYEQEWDEILKNLPFRILDASQWRYGDEGVEVAIDDRFLTPILKDVEKKSRKHYYYNSNRIPNGEWFIEWKEEVWNDVNTIINKVITDSGYTQWKKDMKEKELARKNSHKNPNILTLEDCIDLYTAQEKLAENEEWYCSDCKKHQRATKKIDLWDFPEILIIHLKRFQTVGRRSQKIQTFVDFPIRGLDLSKYVINNDLHDTPLYDLYAVSIHSGSTGGGHYTAFAMNDITHRWYYFSDSMVRPAKESELVSQGAYVLFYKKVH